MPDHLGKKIACSFFFHQCELRWIQNDWQIIPFIGSSSGMSWLSAGTALGRWDLSKWTCPLIDTSLISFTCGSLKSDGLSHGEHGKGLPWLSGSLFQTKLICRLSSVTSMAKAFIICKRYKKVKKKSNIVKKNCNKHCLVNY